MRLWPVAEGKCPCCGRTPPVWTPQAIIDAMQAWSATHGGPPSSVDWLTAGKGHPTTDRVTKVFGSFDAARRAAGLTFTQRIWEREDVIERVFRWTFDHDGVLPRQRDWWGRSPEYPPPSVVKRMFGSWNAALVAAGYTPTRSVRSAAGYRGQARQRLDAVTAPQPLAMLVQEGSA